MIVGYEQSTVARGGIGSLLLAGRKGHDWVYVGSVGTGFNTKDAEDLRRWLDKLRTKRPAVPLKGKNLASAQPTLIAEIEFRGWTHDGSLRHYPTRACGRSQDNAAVFDMTRRKPTKTTGHFWGSANERSSTGTRKGEHGHISSDRARYHKPDNSQHRSESRKAEIEPGPK